MLQRLFPDAYRDDPAASSDFRRFTERELQANEDRRRDAGAWTTAGQRRGRARPSDADERGRASGCGPSPACGSPLAPGSASPRPSRPRARRCCTTTTRGPSCQRLRLARLRPGDDDLSASDDPAADSCPDSCPDLSVLDSGLTPEDSGSSPASAHYPWPPCCASPRRGGRDRRPRPRRPPGRGVRHHRRPGGFRPADPPGADDQRRPLADVLPLRPGGAARAVPGDGRPRTRRSSSSTTRTPRPRPTRRGPTSPTPPSRRRTTCWSRCRDRSDDADEFRSYRIVDGVVTEEEIEITGDRRRGSE